MAWHSREYSPSSVKLSKLVEENRNSVVIGQQVVSPLGITPGGRVFRNFFSFPSCRLSFSPPNTGCSWAWMEDKITSIQTGTM